MKKMMAMNFKCGVPKLFKSVRYTLGIVNIIFLLTGLVLLFIGLAVFNRYSQYDELVTRRFFNISAFTIATGVIIILGTILGFYGAISRHFYVIGAYVILLLVILVFEIAITIAGFALSNDASSEIRTTMVETLKLYGSRIEITKIWDELQMGFQCCGAISRFDWTPNSQIPVSCCYIDYGTISPFTCTVDTAHTSDCVSVFGEYLADQAYIIAIGGLVITCIQVPLIALSVYVAWRSRNDEVEEY